MLDHGSVESGASPIQAVRHRMRHSASHVMADAVLKMFPDARLGIGPPTQDGFYYDFELSRALTPQDLEKIEAMVKQTIAENHPFQREEISRGEAKEFFTHQPYKLEIIDGLPEATTLSTYRHDAFVDLCQGPHLERTGDITAVKLLTVAGAYWRGDEHRPMLQRIYGTAFESQEALDEHLAKLAEAERRDHRNLGRAAGLVLHSR